MNTYKVRYVYLKHRDSAHIFTHTHIYESRQVQWIVCRDKNVLFLKHVNFWSCFSKVKKRRNQVINGE